MQKEVSRAIKGTWILTIASLFSELLSAIYRIPLQNIVGDRGYFIYQQVYPIYGIFSVYPVCRWLFQKPLLNKIR